MRLTAAANLHLQPSPGTVACNIRCRIDPYVTYLTGSDEVAGLERLPAEETFPAKKGRRGTVPHARIACTAGATPGY